MKAHEKLGLLLSWLSRSIYRQWYWQNYKKQREQDKLRSAWFGVSVRYSWTEIKDGLTRWAATHGVEKPPTPDEFYSFIAPSMTSVVRQYLDKAKQQLGDHV